MAGFFGFFDYTKPGPGVRKDAPRKKGVALFFDLYFRKFWNYIKLNMLYAVTSIPAFILYSLIFLWVLQPNSADAEAIRDNFIYALMLSIAAVIFLGGGLTASGYNYILRNYYREEHAWVWSDFWEHTFKNIRQGAAIWVIDTAALFVLTFGIRFYYLSSKQQWAFTIPFGILIVFTVIYVIMHFYIWTMTVTFKLGLRQIFKNSLLLGIIALHRSVGALAVVLAYLAAFFILIPYILTFMLTPFIVLTPAGLIIHMFSYPVIKKYMIDPQTAPEPEDKEADAEPEDKEGNEGGEEENDAQ